MIPAARHKAVSAAGIAVVSASNGGAQTGSASIPAPASIVAGNLLLAVFGAQDTKATLSLASTGWTKLTSFVTNTTNDEAHVGLFWKIATSSEPGSYTFAGATVKALNVGIMQISGVNVASPFNGQTPTTKTGTASTSAVFPALTTTGVGALLGVAAQIGNFTTAMSTSFTSGAGYSTGVSSVSQAAMQNTFDSESTFATLSASAAIAAGSNTPAAGTFNVSHAYAAITVPLKPA